MRILNRREHWAGFLPGTEPQREDTGEPLSSAISQNLGSATCHARACAQPVVGWNVPAVLIQTGGPSRQSVLPELSAVVGVMQ